MRNWAYDRYNTDLDLGETFADKTYNSLTRYLSRISYAEAHFSAFVAGYKLPFAVAGHFSKLAKHAFPYREIAERCQCGRTKTAAVISEALGPSEKGHTTDTGKNEPYNITIDEPTKRDGDKAVAILLRVVNCHCVLVENRFLDMPI